MASSGFDSTYLIWKNLKEGNKVIPLYVDTNINKDQKIIERNNLHTICEYFVRQFTYEKISRWQETVKVDVDASCKIILQQPQVWVYGAYIFSQKEDLIVDEIQLGYIMNDDALSFIDEIKGLWDALNKFQVSWRTNPISQLTFPLIKMPKEHLMEIAATQYPDIFHKIHFCEFPKEDGSNCELCVSCKKAYDKGYQLFLSKAENNRLIKFEYPEKEKISKFKKLTAKGKLNESRDV
jgi:7-cyano-7-deazaguanine synthase in queuosine biosynthesis